MRYDIDNLWYFYASNDETKSIMKKHFLNWHCYRCMFLSQWEWYDDVMMWMQWYDDVIIFQPQWWFYKRLIAIKGDVHDQSFFLWVYIWWFWAGHHNQVDGWRFTMHDDHNELRWSSSVDDGWW